MNKLPASVQEKSIEDAIGKEYDSHILIGIPKNQLDFTSIGFKCDEEQATQMFVDFIEQHPQFMSPMTTALLLKVSEKTES